MTKLPEHLLQPPDPYIDGIIRKALAETEFGGLPLWTKSGCTLFVKVDSALIEANSNLLLTALLENEEYEGVPLIWFDVKLESLSQGQSRVVVFLDILDEQVVGCLDALAYQKWIVLHWYNQDQEYVCSSGIPWTREEGLRAQGLTAWGRGVIERTGGGDFEEAKIQALSHGDDC
ncbi:MAG: hypothetical protein GX825_10045 [Syntrophomonadaceae bacterium]|nr:hypothetical protein [Syntrophomonadaceae bacterium]